jgi:hypothetical protein
MNDSLVNRFDELLHYTRESGLAPVQITPLVQELFPDFDPGLTVFHNDKYIEDYQLSIYARNRALGLSPVEAGQQCKITATLMGKLFKGEGLSLERLEAFAEAELFSASKLKAEHLDKLDKSKEKGASALFLEKVFAEQYSPRSKLGLSNGIGSDNPEEKKWTIEVHHVETSDKRSTDEKLLDSARNKDCKGAHGKEEKETNA